MDKSTTIFRLLNGLRYFGAGVKVKRNIYKFPNTYWTITRVALSKDQNHGKVYGILTWNGRHQSKESRIGASLKPDWILVDIPNYKTFLNKNISEI